MCCISFKNVSKVYMGSYEPVAALRNVSFNVGYGEFVSVIGASGSGKTTLLNLAAGLDVPTEGEIWICGHETGRMDADELAVFRRRNIGVVFQDFRLLDLFDVIENITFPLGLDGSPEDMEYIKKICTVLGISDKLHAMPETLSGGEKQRAAIARAVAAKPAVLLADEPTGNLDQRAGLDVLGMFKYINRELGQTVVMVTHDSKAAQLADRIIRIEDGSVAEL